MNRAQIPAAALRGSTVLQALALMTLLSMEAEAGKAKPPGACRSLTCPDLTCARERTLCLLEGDRPDESLELLKQEREAQLPFTDGLEFHLLLAKTYLAMENDFWALNTLTAYVEEHPGSDCEAKSWIAWIHIEQGSLDEAAHALDDPACLEEGAQEASRFDMLHTFLEVQEASEQGLDPAAAVGKRKKKKIGVVFPEDLELYRFNESVLNPQKLRPLTVKAEAAGGYTTNALMGSPSDPTVSKRMYSSLAYLDLWTQFLPPHPWWISPLLELSGRGIYFFRKEAGADNYPEQYSYLDAGIRPGIMLFPDRLPRLLLAYKGNFLFINKAARPGGEAPMFFYEGHRGELELEVGPHLTLFGGAGKRIFDDMARSRLEFDGGVGAGWTFWGRLSLLGAVTVRYFKAESKAYNDFGVTGLLAATLYWYRGMQVKAMVSLGLDNYMDSRDYFEGGKLRKDRSLKVTAAYLTPAWKGLRGGLVYEFSDKESTVSDYSFNEVRVMVKLIYNFGFDLYRPKGLAPQDHVPLQFGLAGSKGGEVTEKIQDLLRQDESVRRGSSCKN